MKRLAILDDYQNVALSLADWASLGPQITVDVINEPLGGIEAAAARLVDHEILIAMRERTPFPRALLQRLPKLKLLVTTGMRNASIDVRAAAERDVLVCGTSMLPHPTAELTLGLILSLARRIPFEHQGMREGAWQRTLGMSLHGRKLGVVGLGKLGSEVARLCQALHMEVVAWSPNLTAERAAKAGAKLIEKEALFASADIITIHMVLSDRSRGIVDAAALSAMKKSAYLVNTSRGPLVDTKALIAALTDRRIAGAAIDVYDEEPLPADHPLRKLDNVVLTPHLGYVTEDNYRVAYGEAVEDVKAWLAGKPVRVLQPG
ncbi:MAG: D-2-hydroxyacid dehydrogenase family protein [Hyphomicrobiales bacterium]|nr:D-2-hydroxyacid dehydrogenase family protein [Hyphomicrobiales bacterium]